MFNRLLKTTYPEALEKSNEVANEIARNMGEYKLPDGYDMSYPDSKDTSRFYLTSETEQENELRAEYKISNKTAELVAFRVDNASVDVAIFIVGLLIFILDIVLGFGLGNNA